MKIKLIRFAFWIIKANKQNLLRMKLTLAFLVCVIINSYSGVYSQTKFNLNIQEKIIDEVFRAIEKQTGFIVIYGSEDLNSENKLSINIEDATIDQIMGKVLEDMNLTYTITDNYIAISKSDEIENNSVIIQGNIKIQGKVTDSEGVPLPGATIIEKGTLNGTTTDADGSFKLTVTGSTSVLKISFIGFTTQEITVGQKTEINVVLVESAEDLEEVVVTGYQQVNKQRMTGSVETVTAAKIMDKGYLSVDEAIQGQMTGISTIKLSGRPGSGAQIRIRGINTLTGNANPIWIVDGMPMQGEVPNIGVGGSDFTNSVLYDGIGNIPVDDIESITVLKDAAASAIYGARAANGVIVITTKRGSAGKSYLSIRSSVSINEAPENHLNMMSTEQKIAFENSLYEDFPHLNNAGRVFQTLKKKDAGIITESEANAAIDALSKINTDWYDEIFRTAYSQNHSISLQGGNKKTQFYASINYQKETGVVPNNEYNNYGGSLKLTHDFNEKFRINFDMHANYKEDKTTASVVNPLHYATFANPYERPYDENGNVVFDRSYASDLSSISSGYKYDLNILEDINNNTTNSDYVNANLNLKLEYEFFKGLMFSTHLSLGTSYTNSRTILTPGTYSSEVRSWIVSIYSDNEIPDELNNGKLRDSNGKSLSYTWRNTLAFNKYLTKEHFVDIFAGQEISSTKSNSFYNVSPEYDPVYNLVGVPNLSNIEGSDLNVSDLGGIGSSQSKIASFFATATYSYKDKYVISGSGRFDGVDIIGTNNRFTPLWNISFKYNIHKEEFMKNYEWINQLSFRGSFGYTGSIDYNARPFPVLIFNLSSRRYDGEIVPSDINSANPSIKWQRKTDRSLGIDFALFNNRFNGTINYYNNLTKDLLDTKQIAISTGRSSIKTNVASLRNEGLELLFNTVNLATKDFRWTTYFNITFNKNRVLETYVKDLEELPIIFRGSLGAKQRHFIEGYPTQSWYGYEFAGVDPTNGHMLAYIDKTDEDGNPVGHKLENGRYVIDMDTEFRKDAVKFLGNAYPTYTGGFGTSFTYKRIKLSASFIYMGGHKITSFSSSFNGNQFYAARLNTSVDNLYRWRKNGDVTDIPAFSSGTNNAYDSYFIDSKLEDGDFLKFSNLTLTYNLPVALCKKLNINRLALSLSANNLYTWTKYTGIDPETMGSFGYPSARRYSINLNIGI